MNDDQPDRHPHATSTSAQLQASARGWHSIQLAVLGFVGICGVLKSGSGSPAPRDIEILAGIMVLLALAVACWATFLVGRVAWPLSVPEGAAGTHRAARRLRAGLVLTFFAVVLVSTAAAAAWWPTPPTPDGGFVRVETSAGTLCGTLTPGGEGSLRLWTQGQHIDIPLDSITALSPSDTCA